MSQTFSPRDHIASRISLLQEYAPEPLVAVAARLGIPERDLVKLDANENPYGPVPGVFKALTALNEYHYYPDAMSRNLRAAIAAYAGVPAQNIIVGNGSDELIDLTIRLFRPGRDGRGISRIIYCPPTFGIYALDAIANEVEIVTVPRRPGFTLDMARIGQVFEEDASPAILFAVSPNNPDGQLLPDADLQRLLALPALIVLDEAYIEFAGQSRAPQVPEHDNLVVLRTFSKWAGLAGLRVGYGVYPAALMPALWRLKPVYNVNCAAQAAALATLEDVEIALERIELIKQERERLYQRLNALDGLYVVPSETNFLLIELLGISVAKVREHMESRGIMIRYYNSDDLSKYVRISVGTPEQNDMLIEAFSAIGGVHEPA